MRTKSNKSWREMKGKQGNIELCYHLYFCECIAKLNDPMFTQSMCIYIINLVYEKENI